MKLVIFLLLLACFGCVGSAPKPEVISSKVTVSTSGKEINDFEREFIHRVTLTTRELELVSNFAAVQDSFDQFGKGVGLKLLADLPRLSMQKGDVLTAIGKRVIAPGDRFLILKSQIVKGQSSITFLRAGRAYKTLIEVK